MVSEPGEYKVEKNVSVTLMYGDSFTLQLPTRGLNCWKLPAGKRQYKPLVEVCLDIHKRGTYDIMWILTHEVVKGSTLLPAIS